MSIHAALNHVTHYTYDRPVNLGPQVVRLRPAPHCRSKVISYSLRVEPAKHFINWQQDPQSNYLARLVFPEKTKEFKVEVDVVAEMAVYNPFDFFLEPAAERFPFAYDPTLKHELESFQKLAIGIESYRQRNGASPNATDIVGLTNILHPTYMTDLIRLDAWGRPIRYEVVGTSFRLVSDGADGVRGTPDDLQLAP